MVAKEFGRVPVASLVIGKLESARSGGPLLNLVHLSLQPHIVKVEEIATKSDGVAGGKDGMNPSAWNYQCLSRFNGNSMAFVHLISKKMLNPGDFGVRGLNNTIFPYSPMRHIEL